MTNKTNSQEPTEEEIKQQWKWFKESCARYKKNAGTYEQYKKEFLETRKQNQTPEEKKRLNDLSNALNKSLELLK